MEAVGTKHGIFSPLKVIGDGRYYIFEPNAVVEW
jgi:hypothetical protein